MQYETLLTDLADGVIFHHVPLRLIPRAIEVAEGEWQPERLVLIEFPSWDAALGWYRSDEYQALRRIRESCSRTEMVLVEGYRG